MSKPFPRVQAAAVDGRFHNVYHRQVQLERLHKALVDNVKDIQQAIATDYGHTSAEIATEYNLTLATVKKFYAQLKPKEAHEKEYLLAKGQDAPENRVPVGVVYIEPLVHTMFYSAVVPLAAAIAAGNCVVLLLENNLRTLSNLLRKILTTTLNPDGFAVASSSIRDEQSLSISICVYQSGTKDTPKINELVSRSQAPTIAVVDRTADVKLAARELVAARFSFGGSSPYAPDCVFVNEFMKQAFIEAVVKECDQFTSSSKHNSSIDKALDSTKKAHPDLKFILQEPSFAIVENTSRSTVLQSKLDAPILTIHEIKSLDDAIDLLVSKETCLAAYHFGSPATGKYLSQFIDSEVSFINHIPRDLLVGPAAPTGHAFDLRERYSSEEFTLRRPAFIKPAAQLAVKDAMSLLEEASKPLVEMKRHPGGGVGFFEQGFLISAGLILASSVTILGTGVVWWWRATRLG